MSSVVVRSAPREQVTRRVEELAADLRRRHPRVRRIIWFGSWVTGIPTPGSDVDLCLILSDSPLPRRERPPRYLPVGFPVGLDMVVYTEAEFAELPRTSPRWHACITSGREL